MKNKNCILLFAAASVACLMAAGCKKTEFSSVESVPVKTVSISVTGDFNDFISEEGASKAFVENTFRMKWQDGDTVFVYGKAEGADAISCLGKLGATTVEAADSRLADLTGDITAPAEGTKLTLVYSPGLTVAPAAGSTGALSISLASQGGAADSVAFVAYATVDYLGDAAEAAYRTAFNFATSILRVNATGLDADAALKQATLVNVNTACVLTMAADTLPTISGTSSGNINRTFADGFCPNAKGNAAFYVAVPAISANANRQLVLIQPNGTLSDKAISYSGFATSEAGVGRMLNSIATPDVIDDADYVDLSEYGTANCYIVTSKGNYKFDATVMGNGIDTLGEVAPLIEPKSADVLWETYGNFARPTIGSVVNNVSLDEDGYVRFSAASRQGNALIAVRDGEGKILWSWHIWHPATAVGDQTYQDDAGVMMDRNLGAYVNYCSGAYEQIYGLMYQWGRKDPFMGQGSNSSNDWAYATITSWPLMPSESMSVQDAVENPTTFIDSTKSAEWLSPKLWNNGSTDASVKTMYDPCPAGYLVPHSNFFWTAKCNVGFSNYERLFKLPVLAGGGNAYYPMTGQHTSRTYIGNHGSAAYLWTRNADGAGKATRLYMKGSSFTMYSDPVRFAMPVRCLKEL